MIRREFLIARISLFSAMVYVLSLATSFLPNFNLIFFIVFVSGYLWGKIPGMIVGAVGMSLWTLFNPYGPAAFPVMAAQVIGTALGGCFGGMLKKLTVDNLKRKFYLTALIGVVCSLLFFVPVNMVDAYIFQPFWPRFSVGMFWSLFSLGANMIIFPLLFAALSPFFIKEKKRLA